MSKREVKKVTGTSEANSTIIINLTNGKTVETKSDEKGNWIVSIDFALKHGEVISAVAKDYANNESPKAIQTVKDTKAPSTPVVDSIKQTDKKISGTSEPLTIINLEIPKIGKISVETNANGKWKYLVTQNQQLQAGTQVEISAIDKAGNVSQKIKTLVEEVKVTKKINKPNKLPGTLKLLSKETKNLEKDEPTPRSKNKEFNPTTSQSSKIERSKQLKVDKKQDEYKADKQVQYKNGKVKLKNKQTAKKDIEKQKSKVEKVLPETGKTQEDTQIFKALLFEILGLNLLAKIVKNNRKHKKS